MINLEIDEEIPKKEAQPDPHSPEKEGETQIAPPPDKEAVKEVAPPPVKDVAPPPVKEAQPAPAVAPPATQVAVNSTQPVWNRVMLPPKSTSTSSAAYPLTPTTATSSSATNALIPNTPV